MSGEHLSQRLSSLALNLKVSTFSAKFPSATKLTAGD
jgi:hypothetical protein